MPKLRFEPEPIGVEAELVAAIERLQQGCPTNPDLKRKAALGRLRINPTTVALEAGRARGLCAYEGCAYPRVYHALKLFKDGNGKPVTSFEEVNEKLTRENAELRESITLAMSRVVAMLLRMKDVEVKARREVEKVERKFSSHKKVTSLEEVAEVVASKPDVVVPMKRGLRRKRPLHE